jgi:glycosyltransferase involved in cell wall biosynthesis
MTKIILAANTDWYLYNFRRSLAQFLREQGYLVTLVSPAGKYASKLQTDGFRWVEWKIGRQTIAPWLELPAVFALARTYRHEDADLLHHHTIKPVLYGSLAARLAGVANIVNSITGRGYVFYNKTAKASLIKKITRPFYRLAFSHPNQITIFENDLDLHYFIQEKLVKRESARVIASVGVDTNRFTPGAEPQGEMVILLPSRMLWDKGVGVLVEAARRLHSTIPVRVALVGAPDPGNPASIPEEQLQKWAAEGAIEWWGWQDNMSEIFQKAHLVTLPSLYGEGVPAALLEAAACGKPIVTTDTPGCRDIVLDQINGLLVPPNDPLALADALGKLLADPILRGRMGAASRQLVLQKFTVQRVNQATLDVYQDLLARSNRSN